MIRAKTITLIIRILEDCLEEEYTVEELRGKIRDILQLLGVSERSKDFRIGKDLEGITRISG